MKLASCKVYLVLAFVLLAALSVPAAAPVWEDGTFVGEGKGYGGVMSVEVIIEDGAIVEISVLEHGETPILSDAAFNALPARVIEAQSTDIDTVSGATYTSGGMIEAIEHALAIASGEIEPDSEDEE